MPKTAKSAKSTRSAKSYRAKKEHEGKAYTGMRVGRVHKWDYPDGVWHERKVAPSRWELSFVSHKNRRGKAPEGSGAAEGSGYHWLIVADQWVRKVDANTYATVMEGEKHLIGFQKPEWSAWNTQFRNQKSSRQKTIAALRGILERLEAEEAASIEQPWEHPVFEPLDTLKTRTEILRELNVPEEILVAA